MSRSTSVEERMAIVELALAQTGVSDRHIAQRMGLGLSTARQSRRQGQRDERDG